MPEGASDQTVSLTTDAVAELAGTLAASGHRIQAAAGGVARTGPPVPYDWFDLGREIIQLDEAREAFDLRIAGLLAEQARVATDQVARTRDVDVFK